MSRECISKSIPERFSILIKSIRVLITTMTMCSLLLMSTVSKSVDIGGFLLDQSISRSGHDFYRQLSILWQDIPSTAGATVTIKETLIPKAGTVLTVELNNQTVYTTYLGRRLKPIDDQVEQAALILIKVLASNNFSKFSDDLSSSGL